LTNFEVEEKKMIANPTHIITHHGHAHRDELIACAILVAYYAKNKNIELPIYRKEPTQEDLENPQCIVVDVGGKFEIENSNLDHHQLERHEPACCSITQVLKYLGIDLDIAREIFPWLEYAEYIDSKGPGATANRFSIPASELIRGMSPVESALIHCFAATHVILPKQESLVPRRQLTYTDWIWSALRTIGDSVVWYYENVQERLSLLEQSSSIENVDGINVLINDHIPGDKNPMLGVELYIRRKNLTVDVVISQDEREPGLSLFRRNDCPKIDFSRVEGNPAVRFAHKIGFVAKAHPGSDWRKLVKQATVV
jgi:hypothetical protein